MKKFKFNQAGDTIVEVLIALTVLSTVMGSAYAISNRALVRTQQAHERVRATKLAEEQIERLKYLAEYDSSKLDAIKSITNVQLKDPVNKWCISDAKLFVNNATCVTDNIFTTKFTEHLYNQYTIEVSWQSIKTSTVEKVTISYRIPQL